MNITSCACKEEIEHSPTKNYLRRLFVKSSSCKAERSFCLLKQSSEYTSGLADQRDLNFLTRLRQDSSQKSCLLSSLVAGVVFGFSEALTTSEQRVYHSYIVDMESSGHAFHSNDCVNPASYELIQPIIIALFATIWQRRDSCG